VIPFVPNHEIANLIRIAVIVPVWHQARYMASAVQSALDQEIDCGVGVVIVDDGCRLDTLVIR
jgi:glycosyltransferase involved in cell wall biosynthesis